MKVKEIALLFQQELLEAYDGQGDLEIDFEVTSVRINDADTSALLLNFTHPKYTSVLKLYLVQRGDAVKILRSPGWANQFQLRIAAGVDLAKKPEREALVARTLRWLEASFEKTQRDTTSLQRLKSDALTSVLAGYKRAK